jgi:hypothetical protein
LPESLQGWLLPIQAFDGSFHWSQCHLSRKAFTKISRTCWLFEEWWVGWQAAWYGRWFEKWSQIW